MNNDIKKDALLDEEIGYWAMTVTMALLGVMLILLYIFNF